MIIYQKPSPIQLTAIGLTIIAIVFRPVAILAVIAWSAWGWDEIRYGVNAVRRSFGVLAWLGVAAWLAWQ